MESGRSECPVCKGSGRAWGEWTKFIPCPTCCSDDGETTESYPDSDRRQKSPVHKSQVWIHHPDAVSECIVYVFRCTDNLEEGLKNIAELHWEINDLTDKYFEARDQGQLDMARDLKNTCSKSREKAHSAFQKFLTDELVVGTVKYTRPGVHLKEVKGEYIFFIIEVAEKGKYIRAWCHRAKNGDDLHIEGRNIRRGR